MERIVIVAYKPFEGKSDALRKLVNTHWTSLDQENLVSQRPPIVMESENGTIIEVFGWKSREALELAHQNKAVQKMWAQFAEVCEFIPVGNVDESKELFSEFTPL